MAHNGRIRPPGGWSDYSVLLAAEMEAFDAAQYVSITERGGTWAPAAQIIIGGLGGRFTGPLTADDFEGTVTAFKVLAVDPDGQITVGPGTAGHLCSIVWGNFSFAGFDSGSNATWASGSAAVIASGATLTVAGTGSFTGGVTFGSLGTTTFDGANTFSGTSATQVLSGGSFQVNAGATLTSVSVLGIKLTGTAPTKTADPGADNIAIGLNQIKAWGWLRSDGIGGVSVEDGMNVASVTLLGGNDGWSVTLARAMANSTYAVKATYQYFTGDDATNYYLPKVKLVSATVFEVRLRDVNAGANADLSTTKLGVSFDVNARQ